MTPVSRALKGATGLPTWLLVQALRPLLPKAHPWKARFFTLRDWSAGASPFTVMADSIFWLYIVAALVWLAYWTLR